MPTNPNAVNLIWVFTAILLPIVPALLLYKLLPSTADVSGPFHGMQIKLGGAFAGYFLLVLVIFFWPRSNPAYEVWTVRGYIQDENGTNLSQDKVTFTITPRSIEFNQEEGTFEMDILVKRGQFGQAKFPTLGVEWQPAQPFGNATVHLDPSNQLFGKRYELKVDKSLREITVTEPIKLEKKLQEAAYAPAEAAPQPTVLPASVTHDTPSTTTTTPSPSP